MNPNPSVQQLLQMLQDQHHALYVKMGTVTDPNDGQKIMLEAQELLHRISIAQNFVLLAITANVTAAVAQVQSADQQLTADLQESTDINAVVTKVTAYLGYVDQAIDFFKTVAAA